MDSFRYKTITYFPTNKKYSWNNEKNLKCINILVFKLFSIFCFLYLLYIPFLSSLCIFSFSEVDSQDDMFYAVSAITELTKNLMYLNFKRLMPEGIP